MATHYPYQDLEIKPHMDTHPSQYPGMDRITALRQILADNVQAELKRRGYTQPQLAKKAGMAQSHVSRIVNGRAGATIDRVALLAHAFGVDPHELLIKGFSAKRGGGASKEPAPPSKG